MNELTRAKWDFEEAMKMSEVLAQSDIVPKEFKDKPANVFVAIRSGWEIGMSVMQSIQSIAVINGRATIFGDAALALVYASGVCEYIKESLKDGVAMCIGKRAGREDEVVRTFTLAEARRAELTGKDIWKKYESRMLQMRARSYLLRDLFPDVLRGLVLKEEVQDYSTPEAKVWEVPKAIEDKFINTKKAQRILAVAEQSGMPADQFAKVLNSFGINNLSELPNDKFQEMIDLLGRTTCTPAHMYGEEPNGSTI